MVQQNIAYLLVFDVRRENSFCLHTDPFLK
jgi:hypothetical protein